MSEKKLVVYDLRLSYNGPVVISDFYKEVDEWIKEKGMQKEIKKKMEHVTSKGKEVEWVVEASKELVHYAEDIVHMRALFHHVKEVEIEKNGVKMRVQKADVLIIFHGILETSLHTVWEQQPLFYFFRTLIDKYIWPFHSDKYVGPVYVDTHDLYKRLKSFLNVQKQKYI